MSRNLKALGLAAFAVLALGAMFASGASAQEGFFTAGDTLKGGSVEHTDATVVGHQYDLEDTDWNFFQAPGDTGPQVKCDTATFTGTLEDGGTGEAPGVNSTELTIEPDYSTCYIHEVDTPVTVDMHGCDYVFTQPTTAEDVPEGSYTGKADLVCPEGESIVITAYLFGSATSHNHSFPLCTIEVSPSEGNEQELGGHLVYTPGTSEGRDDLTVEANITEINYNDGCNETSGEDGIYKQTVTVEAFDDIDDGEEPTEHNEQLDAVISE